MIPSHTPDDYITLVMTLSHMIITTYIWWWPHTHADNLKHMLMTSHIWWWPHTPDDDPHTNDDDGYPTNYWPAADDYIIHLLTIKYLMTTSHIWWRPHALDEDLIIWWCWPHIPDGDFKFSTLYHHHTPRDLKHLVMTSCIL